MENVSVFSAIAANDCNGFLAFYGETVSCTPSGGSPKNISAIIENDIEQRLDTSSEIEFDTRIIRVKKTDLPAPKIAGRNVADTFSIDGTTWYLRRVISDDGAMLRLLLATSLAAFIE